MDFEFLALLVPGRVFTCFTAMKDTWKLSNMIRVYEIGTDKEEERIYDQRGQPGIVICITYKVDRTLRLVIKFGNDMH
jgi:hypothetical protein